MAQRTNQSMNQLESAYNSTHLRPSKPHNLRALKTIRRSDKRDSVFLGWRTIKEGECAATTNLSGEVELYTGPQRIFLWRKEFEYLDRITAQPGEYLIIEHKSGQKEHIPGPATVFLEPTKHDTISVSRATIISTGQAMVIYAEDNEGKVTTEVMHGPAIRVLKSNEWLHQFSWLVPDQSNPSNATKRPHNFFKLRTIPDQFYYNVTEVRTSDDAVLTVKLMIFYHLKDIMRMLNTTHDPAAELINGVTADIIDFASCRTFEDFKRDSDQLNKTETYAQTRLRFGNLGYDLTKVIYRGYDASKTLQLMHEKAIETRTQIRLKTESEKEEQALESYRLQCKNQRTIQELEMEKQKLEHSREMSLIAHRDAITRKQEEFDASMKQKQTESQIEIENLEKQHQAELAFKQKMNQLEVDYYTKLSKEANVDLTKYLVAKHTTYDKSIRLVGDGFDPSANNIMRVHLNADGSPKAKL
jgi:hypothetical protein